MRATVIVPAWNARAVIGACLDSIARQRLPGGFETIVVDDASTDGTAEVIRTYGGEVRMITKTENAGFSAVNNEAAAMARGRILFFLNNDTELLAPDTLERVVAAAEQPGVGIAAPRLVNPDGTLQPSCAAHPGILSASLVASGLWRLLPNRVRARTVPQFWSHDRPIDTDWLKGAALAVPADVFRSLGGFWPTMYAEEQDLAYRVRRRGLRIRLEPAAEVMHIGNYSAAQRWTETERAARVAGAELAFLDAHYPRRRAAAIRAITTCGHALRAVAHRVLGRRERARVFSVMARAYATARRVGAIG